MPPERCTITVDGRALSVGVGASVAAALLGHGILALGRSSTGAARGPLCAMGSCHGCLVEVVGRGRVRACCLPCGPGLVVRLPAPSEIERDG